MSHPSTITSVAARESGEPLGHFAKESQNKQRAD